MFLLRSMLILIYIFLIITIIIVIIIIIIIIIIIVITIIIIIITITIIVIINYYRHEIILFFSVFSPRLTITCKFRSGLLRITGHRQET